MRLLLLLILPLLSFSQVIRLDPEKEKKLGIKLWEVKEECWKGNGKMHHWWM